MIDFLKNFISGEKTPEEKNLAAQMKKRDVMMVGEPTSAQEGCDDDYKVPTGGGCCGGGCRQ